MKKRVHGTPHNSFRWLPAVCRIASPAFTVLFYASIGLAVLLAMIALILVFVNTAPEDMVLSPYMSKSYAFDGTLTEYTVNLGNGIRLSRQAQFVSLGDIKLALYGFLCTAFVTSGALAVAFRSLGRLAKNLRFEKPLEKENPTCLTVLGITVMCGSVVSDFVARLFNYFIYKAFTDSVDISFVPGFNACGFVAGALITLAGCVFAYALAEYGIVKRDGE